MEEGLPTRAESGNRADRDRRRVGRRAALGVALLSALLFLLLALDDRRPSEPEGRAEGTQRVTPAVRAAFVEESYRPGERAALVIEDPSVELELRVFRSGPERRPTLRDIDMHGVAVTSKRSVRGKGRRTVWLRVGHWPSGLYFARLRAPDGRLGHAPFIVAPRRLGEHRVAVVMPTLTWQAYNFRDEDGDGVGDSWYVDPERNSVRLGRAHLNRGVPYGFRYHLGFHHWLHRTGKRVDYLAQSDLEKARSATLLARAYDLLVFAGHHEYVTDREYDLVEGFRDAGGNLLFLSANNFFYRVERRGAYAVRTDRWRDLGRPEASLVGVQYLTYQRSPRRPWIVRRAPAASWIFAGTGLRVGSRFARGGVEIDTVTSASPDGLQVVAEMPNVFGPGRTAQMAYYTTPSGAKVFAPGAFHLLRSVTSDPAVRRLAENLWAHLSRP